MPTIQSIVEGAPIRIEISGAQGPRGRDAATEVVTEDFTATNDYQYNVTAAAVATDPTGVEGKGYIVFIVGGSATIGGVVYSLEGSIIRRYYKSGAWYSKLYKDSTAYATAAQGTDERVPTAAGLTSKFGTAKGSLVDGDKVTILDSAAADAPKHSLWSVVKSTLKTYFDTVYAAIVHTHTLSAGATDVTITAANLNTLDDGANITLHFHDSDRSRANHTGTQLAATISDFSSAAATASPVQSVAGRTGTVTLSSADITFNSAIVVSGAASSITTTGADAEIATTGANAVIKTEGATASVFTTGVGASITTSGDDAVISTSGANATISTSGTNAHIRTAGGAYIETNSTFKISGGGFVTTLSGTQTANRAIAFPNASGTIALTSDIINAVTSATTSDGTAELLLADVSLTDGVNITTLSGTQTTDRAIAFPDASGTIALTTSTVAQATAALGLKTATTTVAISSATAPTSGQVLTATSGTSATWQTPSGSTYTAGTGLTLTGSAFAIDSTVATLTGSQTLTNKSIIATQLTGTISFDRLVNTQTLGDADTTITSGVRDALLNSALTVSRTYTLPLASAYPAGARISFTDVTQTLTDVRTATLLCAGGDTINGSTSFVLSMAGSSPILISDGSSKWTLDLRGVSRGGTGRTTLTSGAFLVGNGTGRVNFQTIGTGVATALAINTGSAGAFVTFSGALGTPSSATLTNATGLPISTGVSGLGTGVATFLATPTSANLLAAVTDETGTGSLVFATSPTLTTPIARGVGTTTGTAFTVQNSTPANKLIVRDDGQIGVNGYIPSTHLPASGYAGVWMDTSNCGVVGETTSGFKGLNICANATRTSGGGWSQQDAARNSFILSVGYEASNNGMTFYRAAAGSGNTLSTFFSIDGTTGAMTLQKTITAAGTAGAQTINRPSGSVNLAAGATSLVVTNSLCTANSVIVGMIATNDATANGLRIVAGAGSFTIHMLVAPTAETRVNFLLTN